MALMSERIPRSTAATSHRMRAGAPVVAGADGSRESERGLLFAADLADTLDVELVVVHALGLYSHESGWQTPIEDHEREAAALLQTTWCAPLHDVEGLRWTARVAHGSAIEAILRVADEVDAGFIVLGSHGAGNSEEPLLGSTSHWVVRNSHRPVVIVPPGDNHPHRRPGTGAAVLESKENEDR
jgi:nucleotide-binding universal stress UspA family protein